MLPTIPVPPPAAEVLPTREGYDRWAAIYDDENNPLIALEEQHVGRLLGEVGGLLVADIGCGTGRHALRLAAAGAAVTAVDFSEGMLDKARGKPGAEAVRFVSHDLEDLEGLDGLGGRALPLGEASFDRVLCCLVLEHIVGLDRFFQELFRICRPGGFAVVSAMHPAMMLRGIQARFVDPATGGEVRPRSYNNQICDYVMAASRAGFRFDHLGEYAVDEALAAQSPRALKYLGWPMLLTMRLGRPA